ncbi:MAG: tetratricopeptide repeat protein [Bradymonadia bacterium]|jgi:Tfp pilus assembly protein PilF
MLRETKVRQLLDAAEQSARAGHRRRATFFYRRIVAVTQPTDWEHELAHARLGALHLAQGQAALAVAHLGRARALSPEEPTYALSVGQAQFALGHTDAARSPLFDALASGPCRAEALRLLVESAEASGDREAARALARIAARESPTAPWARVLARDYADA